MNFGEALDKLRDGAWLTRRGWPHGSYLALEVTAAASPNPAMLFVHTPWSGRAPWVATHEDLLAHDWYEHH